MNVVKIILWSSALLAFCFSLGVEASEDVGLINRLHGDVSYQGAGVASAKATAFMKVREGDRFAVPAGGVLTIVYFDSGRQEIWKGPSNFKAGLKQSDGQSGNPDVSQLPGGVPARLSQTAKVIQIAKLGRAAGVMVRSVKPKLTPAQAEEVSQAKRTYDSWKATTDADDITPELYLYTVLHAHMLYDDMKAVVATMQYKQPNSPEVKDMAAWVSGRQN